MDISYDLKRILNQYLKDGQTADAVDYVIREIKEEYHDTTFRYIALTAANEDHCFFKGSRRAISHMSSEEVKKRVILNIIKWFRTGYGYKNDEHHFGSWLHFIEMLPEEEKTVNIISYIVFILSQFCFNEELNRLIKKAFSILNAKEKQKLFLYWLKESSIILNHEHNHQTLFRVNAIDESMKDKLVCSLIKTFLRESKINSFMYPDNQSVFEDILLQGMIDSEATDPEIFKLAFANIEKIKLGANRHSGEKIARMLSVCMRPKQADRFLSYVA
jgi:hypothetical protein